MIFSANIQCYSSLRNGGGFSLIELIAVVIIVGVLSTSAVIRFSATDTDLQAAKSDVLAALVFAREIAMARSNSNSIQVVVTATAIDVKNNNLSQSSRSQDYPLSLPNAIQVTLGTGILDFNALGETNSHSIVLTQADRLETITISGVGYAY